MFRIVNLACGFLLAALPATAQSISQHFGAKADSCYQRIYTADHLIKHPTQKVEAIQLSHFVQDSAQMPGAEMVLRLAVRLRGQYTWHTPALCTQRGAKLSCGIECDGGRFDVVARTNSSILITGGSDIYFNDCDASERVLQRAPDDKAFLLHRMPLSNCMN